ncbi:MAG: ATP-binding protein [Pseudomonadota bacterium]
MRIAIPIIDDLPWQTVKRFLPRSLLGRSLLIILVPMVLLQISATYFFYDRHYDVITKRLAQGIAGGLATVIALLEHETPEQTISSLGTPGLGSWGVERDSFLELAERSLEFSILFQEDVALPDGIEPPIRSLLDRHLANAIQSRIDWPFTLDTETMPSYVEIMVSLPDGVLRVLVKRKQLFSDTTYIFVFWIVGSSVLLFLVAFIFMRNQVRPIRRLAKAAESFGKGRDVADFRIEGASEVRQAATAFLQMRARIKRQMTQRTAMLAGVSHDLRTPLTRMKLELAMTPAGRGRDGLATDVTEMEHMIAAYLAFARGEEGEPMVETDLSQLLSEVVEQLRRGGGTIALDTPGQVHLPLRQAAMRRALNNLLENALKHGRQVAATLRVAKERADILIDDDGPGVPVSQRELVFRAFHRLEPGRDPNSGGAGLGLTIARDVARSHGGDVTLEESPLGGLRAVLRLPL